MRTIAGASGESDRVISELLDVQTDLASCLARMLSTDMSALYEKWINAELEAGTHPAIVTEAIVQMAVQMAGTMMLHTLDPADHKKAVANLSEQFVKGFMYYVEHAPKLFKAG